jgi:hypothetical protein
LLLRLNRLRRLCLLMRYHQLNQHRRRHRQPLKPCYLEYLCHLRNLRSLYLYRLTLHPMLSHRHRRRYRRCQLLFVSLLFVPHHHRHLS